MAFRARRRLEDLSDHEESQRQLRQAVAASANVERLLSRRRPDGTIRLGKEYHAYRKFQGAHWTLAALAELGYPPGDDALLPIVAQVHGWLTSPQHLRLPATLIIAGQPDRVRRCASQEGLAIWYLHELGLVDERVELLVGRLLAYQWPDGRLELRQEPSRAHLLGARDPAAHARAGPTQRGVPRSGPRRRVDAAAEFLLDRRLLWRRHDGRPIVPMWGVEPMLIQWPIACTTCCRPSW